MNGQLYQTKMENGTEADADEISQLQRDLNVQSIITRDIEDRLSRLTTRLKPLLLNLPETGESAVDGPASAPLRSAFNQGVVDQNERLQAICRQIARLDYELDF